MAVYKVPQDVEADDKLLGPFSFRQFIYLIVAIMGIVIAWALAQLFVALIILPLPIIVLFGALALPLKKDQPMEIYLAAVLSFYLKPRRRLWEADGIQSLVEIVAPKTIEEQRTKDISQSEAERRLSYLANLVDSHGWAVRGVGVPQAGNAMQTDVYFAAQQTQDVLDDSGSIAHAFDNMIGQADAKRRQEVFERMHQSNVATESSPAQPANDPYGGLLSPDNPFIATPRVHKPPMISDVKVTFNPYPVSMRQAVIHPIGNTPAQSTQPAQPPQVPPVERPPEPPSSEPNPAPEPSKPLVSPDIISLANNPDLSIETIAHEADRIHKKEDPSSSEEVVISLR